MKNLGEILRPIIVPLVTPFNRENQDVEYGIAETLVDHLIRNRLCDSILVSGTTGQFDTLSFEELGYDCAMVVAPYYCRPTQEEILQHFKTVSKQTGMPIMLYNIPLFDGSRSGGSCQRRISYNRRPNEENDRALPGR